MPAPTYDPKKASGFKETYYHTSGASWELDTTYPNPPAKRAPATKSRRQHGTGHRKPRRKRLIRWRMTKQQVYIIKWLTFVVVVVKFFEALFKGAL